MSPRYFAQTPVLDGVVHLIGPEAHHLLHVMRAKPGQAIVLFDGSGVEFSAEIRSIGRKEVELVVLDRREVDRESAVELTLAVALPKGDRQRWLVEKVTELGVARLIPLLTSRSMVHPSDSGLARLRRTVIEATKQCGRTRLMRIEPPRSWSNLVAESIDTPHRLLAHPGGEPWHPVSRRTEPRLLVAIGPEGGFSDEEVTLATTAGWRLVSLGQRILRIETAAICVASQLALDHPDRGGPRDIERREREPG